MPAAGLLRPVLLLLFVLLTAVLLLSVLLLPVLLLLLVLLTAVLLLLGLSLQPVVLLLTALLLLVLALLSAVLQLPAVSLPAYTSGTPIAYGMDTNGDINNTTHITDAHTAYIYPVPGGTAVGHLTNSRLESIRPTPSTPNTNKHVKRCIYSISPSG